MSIQIGCLLDQFHLLMDVFVGKMSVRKLWVAANPDAAEEYTAEVTQNALEPTGAVTKHDESSVDISSIHAGFAEVVRIASLCNVAT